MIGIIFFFFFLFFFYFRNIMVNNLEQLTFNLSLKFEKCSLNSLLLEISNNFPSGSIGIY